MEIKRIIFNISANILNFYPGNFFSESLEFYKLSKIYESMII